MGDRTFIRHCCQCSRNQNDGSVKNSRYNILRIKSMRKKSDLIKILRLFFHYSGYVPNNKIIANLIKVVQLNYQELRKVEATR